MTDTKKKVQRYRIPLPDGSTLEVNEKGLEAIRALGRVRPRPKPQPLSRQKRWNEACADARKGLEDLLAVQEEYEEWKGNLPENLANSNLAEKLETVTGFEIQGALDTIDECEGADLPLGFGRD